MYINKVTKSEWILLYINIREYRRGNKIIGNPAKLTTQGTQEKQSKNTTQYVLLTKHK